MKLLRCLCLIPLMFLCSCSFYVSSKINMSDLSASENKVVAANVKTHLLTSCTDAYINEITQKFKSVGIDARFTECTKNYAYGDDYANFSVPVEIVKDNKRPKKATKVFYFQYVNNLFLIRTAKSFDFIHERDNISFNEVSFLFKNDTSKSVKVIPYMLFVGENPVKADILTIQPNDQIEFELSDVGRKLLEKSNAKYPVFQIVK